METKGYVYVMINPSYEGVVKIGKTTKDPEERAKELSSATGVATPFIVVFKRMFSNCHFAEKLLHTVLTDNGFRVNDSREFFRISPTDAINMILKLEDNQSDYYDTEEEPQVKQDNLGDAYFKKGENYYYGHNGCFIDYDLALEYFNKAAKLGNTDAYELIGHTYYFEKENYGLALKAYKQAVEAGYFWCYSKLGLIYSKIDTYKNEYNAQIAWDAFFSKVERHLHKIDDLAMADTLVWWGVYNYYSTFRRTDKTKLWERSYFFKKYKEDILGFIERHKDVSSILRNDFDEFASFLEDLN